jgi:integrating conjugative element relaxase (TIGR03760 family)
MLSLLCRKRSRPAPSPLAQPPVKGLLRPESPAALLAMPHRQRLLQQIWQRTAVSREQFARLYRAPLERYAALVQQLPASEAHHHAYPGGMLDHTLEIVAIALKLRQAYLLPAGAPPEAQAAEADGWTAGVSYAALLHDIGKIAVDVHVEYADGVPWHPWHGPLARPYRFRYRADRAYRLHSAATGLLYTDVLDPPILDWLSGYPDLWASLLYVLAGQYEHAGVLGELVVQADRASVAQALGGDPAKVKEAPQQALQRKLLDGLRYLVREVLRLNQPEGSDGWLTQDALWLVSKTVCDRLRAHLLSQGIGGVPDRNTAVFDVLQEQGIVQPTADGKAIWRATITSDTGWTHTFTFLRVSPALIWDAGDRPPPFSGTVRLDAGPVTASGSDVPDAALPSSALDAPAPLMIDKSAHGTNATPDSATEILGVFDEELQDAAPPAAEPPTSATKAGRLSRRFADGPDSIGSAAHADATTEEHQGEHFLQWLRDGIRSHRLIVNDAKALVHTVAGTTFLVSPGLFQRYVREHPRVGRRTGSKEVEDWQWVQKQFERLHLHKKQRDGHNIWTCEVVGPRRRRHLHGYLVSESHALFDDTLPDNPFLRLLSSENTVSENDDA